MRLEAVTALGTLRAPDGLPVVQDLLTDAWPAMRVAALRAAVAIDPDSFVLVLSSMDPDNPVDRSRGAGRGARGRCPPNRGSSVYTPMLQDEDRRVVPAVLDALARLKAPDLATVALAELKEPDFAVARRGARLVGELKPAGGARRCAKR